MNRTIYVIRHAEKPAEDRDSGLSQSGILRALHLPNWFPETFEAPDVIFASQPSSVSQRPYQTVMPLAASLNLFIHMDFKDDEFEQLAAHVLRHPKHDRSNILICWHHGNIPRLLHHLGAPIGSYPEKWDEKVFDLVFQLDYLSSKQGPVVNRTKMDFKLTDPLDIHI